MELNRGHVQYLRQMQNARTIMKPPAGGQQVVFEWLVQDALLDSDNRQPSYWEIDNGAKFMEYTDGHGHTQRTTLTKYITRHLGVGNYSERDIELVQQMYGGVSSYKAKHFKVLEGDDLVQAYRDNIDGGDGCMRGYKAPFTKWYAENGVRMVTYRDKARALLWETESGELFLDRIYPNSGAHIFAFHMWAIIHGALIRTNHSLPDGETAVTLPMDPNYAHRKDLVVRMKDPESGLYPYTDTFHYMLRPEDDGTRLYHMDRYGRDYFKSMSSIHGGPFGDAGRCQHCSDYFNCDDLVGGYCEPCRETMELCDHCENPIGDNSYTVATNGGDETWCETCRYGSHAMECVHGCGDLMERDYEPDDWHIFDNGVVSCPTCVEEHTCSVCGDPRPGHSYRYRMDPIENGSITNRSIVYTCSNECTNALVEQVQSLIAGLTCTTES